MHGVGDPAMLVRGYMRARSIDRRARPTDMRRPLLRGDVTLRCAHDSTVAVRSGKRRGAATVRGKTTRLWKRPAPVRKELADANRRAAVV